MFYESQTQQLFAFVPELFRIILNLLLQLYTFKILTEFNLRYDMLFRWGHSHLRIFAFWAKLRRRKSEDATAKCEGKMVEVRKRGSQTTINGSFAFAASLSLRLQITVDYLKKSNHYNWLRLSPPWLANSITGQSRHVASFLKVGELIRKSFWRGVGTTLNFL